jgi:hypothetical protein
LDPIHQTQTAWLKEIGVNNNSFGRFMSGSYKDQWAACQNGTYWSAAKFLACEAIQKKIRECEEKSSGGKRKAAGEAVQQDSKKKKGASLALLEKITSVSLPERVPVYDDCDQIRRKINHFLSNSGVTQAAFLRAIGAASNSLASFRKLKGKGSGAANCVYHGAYRFFEQQRLAENNKKKTAKRVEAEKRWGGDGYPLRHDDGRRWVCTAVGGPAPDKSFFDIDAGRDRANAFAASSS